MRRLVTTVALSLFAAGCATMSPERGHAEVGAMVRERVSAPTGWEKGSPPPEEVRASVLELLRDGLTREEAVRIALVNSPGLQAEYEALGISQAELVEAGLLRNPTIGAMVRFPNQPAVGLNVEFSLVQELLDLFMLPARKRIARQQFEADVLRTAHEALALVAEVREAYTATQAAEKLLQYQAQITAAAEVSAELAQKQYDAGNIAELDLGIAQSAWQEARLALAREELELVERRERMNRLLGLWGENTEWKVGESLPELPSEEPPLEHLERLAIQRRLDVDAARKEVSLMDQSVSLARSSRFLGTVEVGVSTERDGDGLRVTGPSLVLELPIFDQRQALIGRLEAQRRQAERRLTKLSVDARSEVRLARAQLQTSRRMVEHYVKVLLPLRRRVIEQAQLHYNAMVLSPYQLLEARRDEVQAYREYVETLRDYWNARNALENAVGGRLTDEKGDAR
ncbi:TolC family protein [Vitiosangium sp. GDMCC 1.1324]|uniref:TolC family protein n=1 Tax=Vitiosangium sp. (strain GDMCC 1.1324) TaxID=2138576 RepID=UPI000D3929DA|nr:TolC family protein [Vitiosangium sp. GDMCC 1.1324]PTL77203.1 TolC family protein [Vitiosangium sp. GDMCC 1.1324]